MENKQNQKPNFKDSLNLPKTNFSMRANLQQQEPLTLQNWKKQNIYEKLQKERQNAPFFLLHDGPPYANGNIHIGHLLNKVLKDFVVRSQLMLGKNCPFVPGWDCHGLPIEHKVIQDLLKKKPQLFESLDSQRAKQVIRKACDTYSDQQIKQQSEQMQKLLTLADYKNPYLTKNKDYEANVLEVFARLLEKGLVYRQLKPVHWSISNQTALAEAELEYKEKIDPAVYVKFKLLDSKSLLNRLSIQENKDVYCLIWTTTPWTLPANLAIAIHKSYSYSIIKSQDSYIVVATDLVENLEETTGIPTQSIVATFSGEVLEKLSYQHPFIEKTGQIFHAEHVTLDAGSGLVHTAPGHGVDDYQLGKQHQLACYCPVKEDGCYDESVPDALKGKSIWDANPIIIEILQKTDSLYYSYDYKHSYPHDWRSKTPVIFRATEQWFISVDKPIDSESKNSLRSLSLEHIDEQINFVPKWGKNRLRGMLESRPDWCISRQRSWGLPIPAFKTASGNILLSPDSVRAVAKRILEKGSDAWFSESPAELLTDYKSETDTLSPADLDINTLEKMYDIFDVWFESGSSWKAVLEKRFNTSVADVYLEGSDQHRGWFHLSLLPSIGIHQKAPFKHLITHGFMVDKDGYKMSKSTGNALNVDDLLKTYGADVLRWWVASLNPENDIKVDLEFFNLAADSYRKVRNTFRFLLSNLYDFSCNIENLNSCIDDLKHLPNYDINAFILQELTCCQASVVSHLNSFQFKQAFLCIQHFIQQTLSALYCSCVKDRLYCDAKDSKRRKITQKCLWVLCDSLARLCCPFLPHTAEEVFKSLYNDPNTSIHLKTFNTLEFSTDNNWKQVLETRDLVLKALENEASISNPLDARAHLPEGSFEKAYLEDFSDLCGISQAVFHSVDCVEIEHLENSPACQRSWKRDGTVKLRDSGFMLSDRDHFAVEQALNV